MMPSQDIAPFNLLVTSKGIVTGRHGSPIRGVLGP